MLKNKKNKKNKRNTNNEDIPIVLPYIESKNRVIFPRMIIPIELDKKKYRELCISLEANKNTAYVIVVDDLKVGNIGTLCKYLEMQEAQNSKIRVLLTGKYRVSIGEKWEEENEFSPLSVVQSSVIEENKGSKEDREISKVLLSKVIDLFSKIASVSRIPKDIFSTINFYKSDIGAVCDIIIHTLDIPVEKKYKILNSTSILNRVKSALKYSEEHLEVLNTAQEITKETRNEMDKRNKEYYLRTEMDTIKKKLGETTDDRGEEIKVYEEKIKKKGLPEEALKEANVEFKRMKRMHPASHEYSIIATYLDWMLDLPWNDSTEDMLDIKKARKKLNEDHYGLEKPKKRILEYLAIRKLNPDSRSPILCFVGPSGTGKTSIGKSIADAMGRKFQRMSLGGVRDEAVIRGFKRTYLGSMPGRIIQSIKRAGTNNPLIMLDEIDKLGADHRGDPSSALLEALDPEQNSSFNDHYLNVSFDLSKVIFITTANLLERIPPALRDRMEVIKFSGYSQYEKEKIANKFLAPRQLEEHGMKDITFTKYAIDKIINGYTREAGVRNLEREIANVIRGIGCDYIENNKIVTSVTKKDIETYLEIPKFPDKDDINIPNCGIAIGMYYSEIGGGITFYEAVDMEMYGKYPRFTVSGNLKDVMKESITVAMKWIRAYKGEVVGKKDVHLHVPEGATPKDGPSGGAAILVALMSLFSQRRPKDNTAYTGEITLSGKILPVGGIKEKVIGAHRTGIKNIIIPTWCKKDISKIPEDIKSEIEFYFVDTMEDVLNIAFKD